MLDPGSLVIGLGVLVWLVGVGYWLWSFSLDRRMRVPLIRAFLRDTPGDAVLGSLSCYGLILFVAGMALKRLI